MREYAVLMRDASREAVAEVDQIAKFTAVLKFNAASTWEMEYVFSQESDPRRAAKEAKLATLFDFGNGIILRRNGEVILSGDITDIEEQMGSKGKKYILRGIDDTGLLAGRVGLPVPSGPPYSSASHDVRTGAAETVMREYVYYNAGAGATSDRQIAGLTLAADEGRGETVTGRARFVELLYLLEELALAGGDLGFKVVQTGTGLQFQVYQPVDRSARVKFSMGFGNLVSYKFKETAPTGNYNYMGGQGELTARVIAEDGDEDSIARYGRIEFFKDQRNEADPAKLATWIAKELAANANKLSVRAEVSETESLKFGEHFGLGDKVTLVTGRRTIVDLVREVKISLDAKEVKIEPVVATAELVAQDGLMRVLAAVRELDRRVARLEVA